MNDSPIDLTIMHRSEPGQSEIIRLEGRDHLKLVFRIDMSPADLVKAFFGQPVIAAYSGGGE